MQVQQDEESKHPNLPYLKTPSSRDGSAYSPPNQVNIGNLLDQIAAHQSQTTRNGSQTGKLSTLQQSTLNDIVIKRLISNSKDIIIMIQNGELLNCMTCNERPVDYYCNNCQNSLCFQCKSDHFQNSKSCPNCRFQNPEMIDIAKCKQIKSLIKKLKRDLLQESDISKSFKCKLCRNLMQQPKSCPQCMTNFCNSCIESKLFRDNRCPFCKKFDPQLRNLHKSLLDIMNIATINCLFCQQPQRYQDHHDHEFECKRKSLVKNKSRFMKTSFDQQITPDKIQQRNIFQQQLVLKQSSSTGLTTLLIDRNLDNSHIGPNDHTNNDSIIIQNIGSPNESQNMYPLQLGKFSSNRELHMSLLENDVVQVKNDTPKSHTSKYQAVNLIDTLAAQINGEGDGDTSSESSLEENAAEDFYFAYGMHLAPSQVQNRSSVKLGRSSTVRRSIVNELTIWQDIKQSTRDWWEQFKDNTDIDDCSSKSNLFYVVFFIFGTTEFIFALSLLCGFELVDTGTISTYSVDKFWFSIAFGSEFVYWFITRIILMNDYYKTYGLTIYRHCFTNTLIMFIHTFLTILPCEMLIFFGYEGHYKYDISLLNFSWLRRIVSTLRIIGQIMAIDGLLGGDYIILYLVLCSVYFLILLPAICPSSSKYDASAWYRIQ